MDDLVVRRGTNRNNFDEQVLTYNVDLTCLKPFICNGFVASVDLADSYDTVMILHVTSYVFHDFVG